MKRRKSASGSCSPGGAAVFCRVPLLDSDFQRIHRPGKLLQMRQRVRDPEKLPAVLLGAARVDQRQETHIGHDSDLRNRLADRGRRKAVKIAFDRFFPDVVGKLLRDPEEIH